MFRGLLICGTMLAMLWMAKGWHDTCLYGGKLLNCVFCNTTESCEDPEADVCDEESVKATFNSLSWEHNMVYKKPNGTATQICVVFILLAHDYRSETMEVRGCFYKELLTIGFLDEDKEEVPPWKRGYKLEKLGSYHSYGDRFPYYKFKCYKRGCEPNCKNPDGTCCAACNKDDDYKIFYSGFQMPTVWYCYTAQCNAPLSVGKNVLFQRSHHTSYESGFKKKKIKYHHEPEEDLEVGVHTLYSGIVFNETKVPLRPGDDPEIRCNSQECYSDLRQWNNWYGFE